MNKDNRRHTHAEKRAWVLARLMDKWEYSKRTSSPACRPFICAIEEDDQAAWEAVFGGKVHIYTVGPNVSPDFARTLRRMWMEGDLKRSVIGNQDARYYAQKTYVISYAFAQWPLSTGGMRDEQAT